jgi:hypothetical protein
VLSQHPSVGLNDDFYCRIVAGLGVGNECQHACQGLTAVDFDWTFEQEPHLRPMG